MFAWHLHGVLLPDGTAPVDVWIDASGLSESPLVGARTLPGAYLLPGGIVDAHFHATLDFEERGLTRERLREVNLDALQRSGVLAARDMGSHPTRLAARSPGPVVHGRADAAVPPGRHFPGLGDDAPPDRVVDLAVDHARAGAHWVKVVLDFPGPDGNWFAAPRNYDEDTLERLVRAVHAEGARVAVHTTGPAAADAVRAGVDSIEHGPSLDAAAVEEMARRGTLGSRRCGPPRAICAGSPARPPSRSSSPGESGCASCSGSRCASASTCSWAPTSAPRARPFTRSSSSSRPAASRRRRR